MDNEPLGWERELFLELQRALDAAGDQIEEFIELGAFSLFLHQPNLHPVPVQIAKRTYQVWSSTGELIVRDDRERWSRFRLVLRLRRELPSCEATFGSALDADELVCLVAVSPELAEVIAQSLPASNPGDTEPSAERRRCPRRPRGRRRL